MPKNSILRNIAIFQLRNIVHAKSKKPDCYASDFCVGTPEIASTSQKNFIQISIMISLFVSFFL